MAITYKLRNKKGQIVHANEATVAMLKSKPEEWDRNYTILEVNDSDKPADASNADGDSGDGTTGKAKKGKPADASNADGK
jgi:hypothetical protein